MSSQGYAQGHMGTEEKEAQGQHQLFKTLLPIHCSPSHCWGTFEKLLSLEF